MNLRHTVIKFGLLLALAIPSAAFAGDALSNLDTPMFLAKDEAKCEICLKKLTASCDKENKICVEKNGAQACQAYYEKCKESVRGRCGGPTMCD